jgi:hypothetical protein
MGACLSIVPPAAGIAAPVELQGLVFSDEEGGLEIRGGHGTGTEADPFVIIEDISDTGPAILTIRGIQAQFGNRAGTDHAIGFVLTKIVRNSTPRTWHSFELELREIKNRPSPYEDGLSFGQLQGERRRFASDRFTDLQVTDEPLDAVVFSGAQILPGETVTVRIVITDYSPNWQFYLLQRRDVPLAGDMRGPPPR